MNKRELAKNFSVSLTTVDKWLSRGCPYEKKDRQYSFNLSEVIAWHREYFLLNNKTSDFQQSKAKKEHYRAELARLEFEKESGLLVEKEKYNRKIREVMTVVKDALLLLPRTIPFSLPIDKASQKLVVFGLDKEIKRILRIWVSGIQAIQKFTEENKQQ